MSRLRRPVPPSASQSNLVSLAAAACAAACGGVATPESSGSRGAPGSDVGASAASASSGRFREVAVERGLTADLARAEEGRWFMPDSLAGGAALADVDGDGDLDALLAHGRWRDGAPTVDGLARLWVQGADGRFTDTSAAAGVVGPHYGMGLAVGDVDDDGDIDVFVTCFGPDVLLRNRGDGTFEDVSEAAGVRAAAGLAQWGASATFVDVDADGALDLFVTNYVVYPPGEEARDTRGNPEYASPINYPGTTDVLLANRGDGTFVDVTAASGIGAKKGRGLGVAAADLDGDGRVDLYVANDAEANFAWVQRGGAEPLAWRFEERGLALGLALSGDGRAEASMGVARGDLDADGREDLFLTHLAQETHTLYLSRGATREAGAYSDRTLRAGLAAPTVDLTGFGTALEDLDLDGLLDLVIVNGRVLRGPERPGAAEAPRWRPYAEPGLVLLGRGTPDAPRFEPVDGGALTSDVLTRRGLACGDFDRDGDVDLLVTTAAGAVRLYEHEGAPSRPWLGVRAVDPARGGRDVLGALVTVESGGRAQSRVVQTCHGYLSASEPVARFGLGAAAAERVTVTWPGGARERYEAPETGRVLSLARGAGAPE